MSAAIVRASYPVSFQLLNSDRQPILGIFDGQQGQTLKLEITNSSRRNMKPKALTGNPSAENHHFELRFRPGTLLLPDSARPAISVAETGWKISDKPVVGDTGVSFYLLITNPATIESGKSISVTLNNLSGDGKVGAHGTRVLLKWNNNLEYAASGSGQSPEPLVPGHRLQHLSLVNQSGQKHIPLHIGIVGNDKVLNNGKANELKLRITNLVKKDPLKPGEGNIRLNPGPDPKNPPATKFIFSFDAAGLDKPWALGEINKVNKIGISAGTKFNTPTATEQSQSVQWIMWPTEAITLEPEDSIDLKITNIETEHPSGLTNLYIHYKNIPGYWDGDFVALIEKAPLVYGTNGVGIGTNDPKERLHVAGKLRVDNELSVGEKVTVDKLRVEKDVSVGGTGVFAVDAPSDPGGRLRIDTESKVSVKKLRVEKDVSVGGVGVFEIDANNAPAGRLKIDTDGNVGIGTATPEKHLHVAGTGNQEMMIQSKDAGGVKWSLQSSGSSGRFEIFNRTADQNRFTILKDGNVGIGTTDPGSFINTANYFKADKDGRILEVHSPTRESVLILSTNQDANTAHLGGLYFTRTAGQGDAHREVAAIKCRQVNAGKFAGGHLHFFTKVGDDGIGPNSPRMVITDNGKVGIGTTTPAAPLHVIGGQANSFTLARWMDGLNLGANGGQRSDLKHSIIADERIRAAAFDTVSDARVKTVLGTSEGASDLDALLKIIITDYTYKDVIGRGNGTYKKAIGQQIEKVFPQAVTRVTDVVPDIYQQASICDGWIALATELKKGDRVKVITETSEGVYEVLEVTPDKFRIALEHEGDQVFVFGREVNDFLTVDYDAIAMLNVSATQQLKKEMDQELKALRVENAELRAANGALAKRLQLLESKLEAALGVMAATNGSNGNGRH